MEKRFSSGREVRIADLASEAALLCHCCGRDKVCGAPQEGQEQSLGISQALRDVKIGRMVLMVAVLEVRDKELASSSHADGYWTLGSSSILNFWYFGEWESSKAHCLRGIYLQIKFNKPAILSDKGIE